MIAERLSRLISTVAGPTLLLRAGVIGGNFVVMMGLAWGLGLARFGEVAVLWSMAMMAATTLSIGAPLLLLRVMGDGTGIRASALVRQGLVFPALLTVIAVGILPVLVPGLPWGPVMLVGLAINGLNCLASMMRALGSVQLSMFLRDGAPQLALGMAACVTANPSRMLIVVAIFLSGTCLVVLWRCLLHPAIGTCLRADGDRGAVRLGLWANAVVGMATAQVDIILGGHILPADQIGIYALLRRIANLVALPVSVATWVSAGPIAAAFGALDRAALRMASTAGSRVALWPGAILFGGALSLVLIWPGLQDARSLALLLIGGAFVQVFLASGFTVATLCGMERFALGARMVSLGLYLVLALGAGLSLTPMGNALAYLAGIIAGGGLLWWMLWRQLRIDTSALSLWGVLPCKQP